MFLEELTGFQLVAWAASAIRQDATVEKEISEARDRIEDHLDELCDPDPIDEDDLAVPIPGLRELPLG